MTYSLEAQNSGNISDTFWVEAAGTWPSSLDPGLSFDLPLGASQAITVTVSIPVEALLGSQEVTTVTLRGDGQESGVTSLLSTTVSAVPFFLYLPIVLE